MAENTEILKVTREIIDGVSRFVHSSADGRIVVVGGPDDQLPDGDGVSVFTPKVFRLMCGSSVYRYRHDCGRCLGELAILAKFCHHCGARAGHWDSHMGYAGDVDAGSSFVPTAIE